MARIDWNAIPIGAETKSLTEWCRQTGVDRETAYRRINDHDWPAAQAVGLEPRVRDAWAEKSRFQHKRDVRVSYKGESHTLKEWHEISKTWDRPIPYRTLVYRYNQGYEPEDLFDTRRQTRTILREKKVERLSQNWSESDIEWTQDAVDT
jgi:hypothetical protein